MYYSISEQCILLQTFKANPVLTTIRTLPFPSYLLPLLLLGPQISSADLFHHFAKGKEHHWNLRTLFESIDLHT